MNSLCVYMKIKILKDYKSYSKGQIIDISNHEASHLIDLDIARKLELSDMINPSFLFKKIIRK
jgi:hypothetical protein